MNLRYTERALSDLERLFEFVAGTDPEAAGQVGRQLLYSMEHLTAHPGLGRVVEGYERHPVRQWVTPSHVVRYRVRDDEIVVIRVWHVRESRRPDS